MGYICLFICKATKAMHLELVIDLSREQFLEALCRLLARKGKSVNLYSDNGTTFVGAARKPDDEFRLAVLEREGI